MPANMAVHVCFCVCRCPGTISTTSPSGEQDPAGGGGHRLAHVQPGLTLAMDPAGGQRRGREEERTGKKRIRKKEKGRDGG